MAKPKLALIPAAQGDKFYSVLPSDGVGDFDFTRNSSATRIAPTGFIETSELFGSELVTNGNFDNDSDWNKGTGWTISGGTGNCDGTGANALLYQNNIFISGKNYNINFRITSYTSGVLRLRDNGVLLPTNYTAIGNYTLNLTATQTGFIGFQNYSSFIGSIDNISVVEVIGKSRLNYDLLNGKVVNCPHYLLEPARTNLVTYSEDFSQWTPNFGASVTSNSIVSPNGTQNASKLMPSSSVERQAITIDLTANGDILMSVFAKKGEYSVIQFSDAINGAYFINFDLQTGLIGSSNTMQGKIENYGNDWYRCSASYNSLNPILKFRLSIAESSTSARLVNFAGNSSDGLYLWGAQLEQGSYPTSYIPTNGTAITRAAETATGSGNAATFNDSEGVLMAEISAFNNIGSFENLSLSNGTNSSRLIIFYRNTLNVIEFRVTVNNVIQMQLQYTIEDAKSFNKMLIKYKQNDFSVFVNGFKIHTDSSGITFGSYPLNYLSFDNGQSSNPSSQFYGNTREIQYFDSALTDAQLETLTSWTSLQEMITSQLYTNY